MKDRAIAFQGAVSGHKAAADAGSMLSAVRVGLLVLGAATAGCSMSVPMGGSVVDEVPTGTVKASHPSPFSSRMDVEDWRRAKSALDTALDPQGNGASVAWDNPASGARGSFVPLGQVYPKGDGICRPFAARVAVAGEAEKVLNASACRVNSGEWVVGQVGPEPVKAKAPRKGNNLAERDSGTHLR